MEYPSLLKLQDQSAYFKYFSDVFCNQPIQTFDGYFVYFKRNNFYHAFFKSSKKNHIKDSFSIERAERMNWIKTVLQDPEAELYCGWDNKKKRAVTDRRVAIVKDNYVVIVRFNKQMSKAFFVTAFSADNRRTIKLIRSNSKWK